MEAILYLTVSLGVVSAFCSAGLGVYFMRSTKRVSRSVAWMYFAEAIAMTVTVAFSIGEGVLVGMFPVWLQTLLRVTMFTAAITSSVHMAMSLDGILRGTDE